MCGGVREMFLSVCFSCVYVYAYLSVAIMWSHASPKSSGAGGSLFLSTACLKKSGVGFTISTILPGTECYFGGRVVWEVFIHK